MENREIEFRGRVQTLYGPVTTWSDSLDPDPLDGPTDGQFLLTSDVLTAAQMGLPNSTVTWWVSNASNEVNLFGFR